MTTGPKYLKEVFGIRYKLKTGVMTSLKDKDIVQAKSQVEMISDCKALNRT